MVFIAMDSLCGKSKINGRLCTRRSCLVCPCLARVMRQCGVLHRPPAQLVDVVRESEPKSVLECCTSRDHVVLTLLDVRQGQCTVCEIPAVSGCDAAGKESGVVHLQQAVQLELKNHFCTLLVDLE